MLHLYNVVIGDVLPALRLSAIGAGIAMLGHHLCPTDIKELVFDKGMT